MNMTRRRAEIASAYSAAFSGTDGLQCPAMPTDVGESWHLYILRLDIAGGMVRDTFIAELTERGIGTSVHFIPLHLHSYYAKTYGLRPDDLPNAKAESDRAVSLPIYSTMTDDDVEYVIDGVLAAADTCS